MAEARSRELRDSNRDDTASNTSSRFGAARLPKLDLPVFVGESSGIIFRQLWMILTCPPPISSLI